MPVLVVLPSIAERNRGLERPLHVERGDDLDAAARDLVAAVGEAVHAASWTTTVSPGPATIFRRPIRELHRALEHVEGLVCSG